MSVFSITSQAAFLNSSASHRENRFPSRSISYFIERRPHARDQFNETSRPDPFQLHGAAAYDEEEENQKCKFFLARRRVAET